jgi:hypothetical protein
MNKRKLLQYMGCGIVGGMGGCLGSFTGGQCGPGEDTIAEIAENYDSYLNREGEITGETYGSYGFGPDVDTGRITIDDSTGRATVVFNDAAGRDIPDSECFEVSGTVAPLDEVILQAETDDIALIDADIIQV